MPGFFIFEEANRIMCWCADGLSTDQLLFLLNYFLTELKM